MGAHKLEKIILQKFSHQGVRVLNPMSDSPAWEYALGGGAPGAFGFEGQQDLILVFNRTGGNTLLLEGTHKDSCIPGPREKAVIL